MWSSCVGSAVSFNFSLLLLSNVAWFCFFHKSEYKLPGFARSSKWLPCSAIWPFSKTMIVSASTTVESLWAITIVVLSFVTRRKASNIFCQKRNIFKRQRNIKHHSKVKEYSEAYLEFSVAAKQENTIQISKHAYVLALSENPVKMSPRHKRG